MTKRKLVMVENPKRQAPGKKQKVTKALLKKTDYKGDIITRNLHAFSARVVNPNQITRAKFLYSPSSVVGGTTTGVGGSIYFILSDVYTVSDYTNLYDQYRIVSAEVHFTPYSNQWPLSSSAPGRLWTVIDYDDSTALTSRAQAQAYNNVVSTAPWSGVTRTLVPHTAVATYNGSFAGYQNTTGAWIDTANASVQYYGVKYWADPSGTTTSSWFIEVSVYCEFRNIRQV